MLHTRLSRCRGFFVFVRKSIKVFKKGMLSLDFFGFSLY
jgi:TolB-like protein